MVFCHIEGNKKMSKRSVIADTKNEGSQKMSFEPHRGFEQSGLPEEMKTQLMQMAVQARGNILKMTSIAGSGHPGGSMSSIDIYLVLYNMARIDPNNPTRDDRDRIIISHGHTSPGVYSALAATGFFDRNKCISGFRQCGSPFEGHVEISVPGIEWDTGNLGQGLSVGVGKAIYGRLKGYDFHTFVVMGDGEQQKGQLSEARRMAAKEGLHRLTAIVDYNRLQISGRLRDVMPQDIASDWEADGWQVREIDGHDFEQIYAALHNAVRSEGEPIMLLARTTMGKGVGFMENDERYHGQTVKPEMLSEALAHVGASDNDLAGLVKLREEGPPPKFPQKEHNIFRIEPGTPITYEVDQKLDNRSAWGKALVSLTKANENNPDFTIGVFDCDLAGSVKTAGFAEAYPESFFQAGIAEHNTATVAGALSAENAISVWADFGVFAIDETYNQARLNDINHTNLKIFCTHSGVQVGEDGKTHQCIDYFGLLNSTFGWKVLVPADPNHTDRITRFALSTEGNFAVIMGRSVAPIITTEDGKAFYGDDYQYRYGHMDWLRHGEKLVIVSAGNMAQIALQAWDALKKDGLSVELAICSDWSDIHHDDLKRIDSFEHLITLEDHNVKTGLGSALAVSLFEAGARTTLTRMGVNQYASSGKPNDLFRALGLDAFAVVNKVKSLLS